MPAALPVQRMRSSRHHRLWNARSADLGQMSELPMLDFRQRLRVWRQRQAVSILSARFVPATRSARVSRSCGRVLDLGLPRPCSTRGALGGR